MHDHLDHAAEGVALLVCLVDPRDHLLARVGVEAAHRVLVEAGDVVGGRDHAVGSPHGSELDDVGDDPRTDRLLEEVARHPAQRDPGGRLAGGGALEHGPGLVEAVLLHADEVRVARAGAGSAAALRASASSSAGSTGSADITFSHLGHSVLPIWIATGPPWVSPWRTPPTIVTSSCSNFIRAPRP